MEALGVEIKVAKSVKSTANGHRCFFIFFSSSPGVFTIIRYGNLDLKPSYKIRNQTRFSRKFPVINSSRFDPGLEMNPELN